MDLTATWIVLCAILSVLISRNSLCQAGRQLPENAQNFLICVMPYKEGFGKMVVSIHNLDLCDIAEEEDLDKFCKNVEGASGCIEEYWDDFLENNPDLYTVKSDVELGKLVCKYKKDLWVGTDCWGNMYFRNTVKNCRNKGDSEEILSCLMYAITYLYRVCDDDDVLFFKRLMTEFLGGRPSDDDYKKSEQMRKEQLQAQKNVSGNSLEESAVTGDDGVYDSDPPEKLKSGEKIAGTVGSENDSGGSEPEGLSKTDSSTSESDSRSSKKTVSESVKSEL